MKWCQFHMERDDQSKTAVRSETKGGSAARPNSSNISIRSEPCEKTGERGGEQEDRTWAGEHRTGDGRLDGGKSPLTRVMNLQKRARKFGKSGEEDIPVNHRSARRKSGQSSHSERSGHHSEDDRTNYPPGLHTTLKPLAHGESRRKSEGDVTGVGESSGKIAPNLRHRMGGNEARRTNVPPELIKATIKPTGVPLATEHLEERFRLIQGTN